MNWRGRPLTSHEVIVETIGATTTRAGLTVHAELDEAAYPKASRSPTSKSRHFRPGRPRPSQLPRRMELTLRAEPDMPETDQVNSSQTQGAVGSLLLNRRPRIPSLRFRYTRWSDYATMRQTMDCLRAVLVAGREQIVVPSHFRFTVSCLRARSGPADGPGARSPLPIPIPAVPREQHGHQPAAFHRREKNTKKDGTDTKDEKTKGEQERHGPRRARPPRRGRRHPRR